MELKLKRATEPPAKSDGARVLVDRLWPRGISKERLKLDEWLKQIAPSTALRKWFNHDPEKWNGFRERYAKELDANPEAVKALQDLLREHGTVTLIFDARDTQHNDAVVLQQYMRRRMPRSRSKSS
ncbi:MAG TPA: DUF488 family protein [Rhodanobacteraceae bacterium]|nr:DUF488 family protein [Rhodanobacteraceae bacterium]